MRHRKLMRELKVAVERRDVARIAELMALYKIRRLNQDDAHTIFCARVILNTELR